MPSPSNPTRHHERLHLGTTGRAGPALIPSRGFSGTDTLQLSCVTTIYSRSKLDHGMQRFDAFRSRPECLTGDVQRVQAVGVDVGAAGERYRALAQAEGGAGGRLRV